MSRLSNKGVGDDYADELLSSEPHFWQYSPARLLEIVEKEDEARDKVWDRDLRMQHQAQQKEMEQHLAQQEQEEEANNNNSSSNTPTPLIPISSSRSDDDDDDDSKNKTLLQHNRSDRQ